MTPDFSPLSLHHQVIRPLSEQYMAYILLSLTMLGKDGFEYEWTLVDICQIETR